MPIHPLPSRLADMPRHSGMVIPYITARHPDRVEWALQDPLRAARVLAHRLCQICGQSLTDGGDRVVVYARPEDFEFGVSPEPGMHPECARYSHLTCPMLAARVDRYHKRALRHCGHPGCDCRSWPTPDPGQASPSPRHAEAWYAAWIASSEHRIVRHPETEVTGPELDYSRILTVRKVRDAATIDHRSELFDLLVALRYGPLLR